MQIKSVSKKQQQSRSRSRASHRIHGVQEKSALLSLVDNNS